MNPALVQAISDETDGNPFFIREVLIHLVEEGKLYREDGDAGAARRSRSPISASPKACAR